MGVLIAGLLRHLGAQLRFLVGPKKANNFPQLDWPKTGQGESKKPGQCRVSCFFGSENVH
jgi:hypothetical protein